MNSSALRRVAVIGAPGRMGRMACALLEAQTDLAVVARVGRGEDLGDALVRSEAELGLDLTVAGAGAAHGERMLELGVRPVIGTSGVSLDENRALDELARERGLGGLVVPNFSLGVWLLQRACEEAARFFPDAEIVEMHGKHKKDKPSGTALDTAERMAAARDAEVEGSVPIHSVRLPGLYSNQEVMFGGLGEVLRLRHETYSMQCFEAGILAALRYASRALGVGRGIGAAFEDLGVR
ncbi:MAG: 4-hydroxy-tetrahydrodipicolinate reductase [Planctomycetes bacterium]|nr:4-hydroxy-tetrahydrodipicolinate reductase [Planctomycetota bacterium]